ncbi:hypothetical protein GJ744_010152 [Endocarpon pusillum]|uniref:Uncharacterized protein n=1 Tax=Endocarpon pusillum TaxID=364733 RepID=A0A8H7AEP4_9EURO|nr:hypothetical protein GJ744_010152 [Endocarpon pusillum]
MLKNLSRELETDRCLEEVRAREATATASTRARASHKTKTIVTALVVHCIYHAMPDENGFRHITDLLLEDDLIENELDLTDDPLIDHPIDPRPLALPSAPSNEPISLLH